MPENSDSADFEILDDYVRRIHEGEAVDRAALLREHPHLASMLRAVEAIEGIAPAEQPAEPAPEAPAAEQLQSSDIESSPSHSSWSAPNLPCDFGEYTLLEEIGRGGMGVVYRAKQKDLDRVVALKMILPTYLSSPIHVRRFLDEAKAAAGLHHAHIVPIYDVGNVHGQHFFTMEYIEGRNLSQRIADAPIEPDEAAHLMAKIARAVAYLHREGVIHRDLKPSNILLDQNGDPHLTDFGLAKTRAGADQTTTGAVLGTPAYMAPEQAAGRSSTVDPLADVYSLGAILYELLTERPPFREATPLDTLMQVMAGEPPLPRQLNRSVPRAMQLICMKCLSKKSSDRYATGDGLADDLDRYLREESLEAKPPSLYQRVLRWGRRQPALAARLLILGVFFGIETTNFCLGAVSADFHNRMLWIMALWLVVWTCCQQLTHVRRLAVYAHIAWGVADAAILLQVLLIGNGLASPLLVVLPLMIMGAGLWVRERFVWMMTCFVLLAYIVLMLDYHFWRREVLEPVLMIGFDRHAIFAVMLVTIGGCTAHLVHRIRALSRYCGRD